ncbi:MAG TPA: folylpolyglutamate synthase/dihydrofolate synthase family protein [Puia sp.]|nr:folylpolyglutamate synthase/dihydrofolate synthase family protein [Puia sp.]
MDYNQTVDYLLGKLPMFSRIGAAAFKKDLTNTKKLCAFLGDPQTRFKSVHIAGTNGKGSTSHMLAAVFQSAGYQTGLYTSPHLRDFRERIKINGTWISEEFVVDFVERIRPMIEELEPSFFEITVAMAFDYFAQRQVDIAIVEVGLGGRLDSTNIITPELAVITNISYDHMNMLGDTLDKIAYEKAGIIKPRVPVVVGEKQDDTHAVFASKAASLEAPLYFADQHRYVAAWEFKRHLLVAEVTSSHDNSKQYYQLDLHGLYQLKNLVTVLEALQRLQELGWNITETHIQNSLERVKKLTGLHGRWEVIHENPLVILDVAHNEDGIRQLALQIEVTDHESLHIVIGMVKDKETAKIVSLLPPHARYYFTKAQIPRALPEEQLAAIAAAAGLHGNHYPDVNTAFRQALSQAGRKDLVMVCGSVFVVGELDVIRDM